MNNPFDYFERIFCVTAEGRDDIYARAIGEFERLGIADRVEKFNGSETDRKYLYGEPDHDRGAKALATSLCHVSIIQMARDNNWRNVFIFEDDIKCVDYNPEILSNALNEVDKMDVDLFYLGYCLSSHSIGIEKISDNLYVNQKGHYLAGVHAYCINNKAYDYILNNCLPLKKYDLSRCMIDKPPVIDMWLWNKYDIHFMYPLMFYQDQDDKERRFRCYSQKLIKKFNLEE